MYQHFIVLNQFIDCKCYICNKILLTINLNNIFIKLKMTTLG